MFDRKCSRCEENTRDIERLKQYKFNDERIIERISWEVLNGWNKGIYTEHLIEKIVERINAVQLKRD